MTIIEKKTKQNKKSPNILNKIIANDFCIKNKKPTTAILKFKPTTASIHPLGSHVWDVQLRSFAN